jgi:hypothetical protein
MASLHGTRQVGFVGFQGLHEPPWIPEALIGVGRDPAGPTELETRGQIQHFLFGAGAAVEQNPGALRQTPRLARLAKAEP